MDFLRDLFDRFRYLASGVPGAGRSSTPLSPRAVTTTPGAPGLKGIRGMKGPLALGETAAPVSIPGVPQPVSAPTPDAATYKVVPIPVGAKGTQATLKVIGDLAIEASQDPHFVQYAQGIVRECRARDYDCMRQKIYDFVAQNVKYQNDPLMAEMVASPGHVVFVSGTGDCFVKGTKVLLREGMRTVPVESLRVGDEIWGYDKWSRVENTWERGVKKTWLVCLNNGSTMRFSPEHKVYVAYCQNHEDEIVGGKSCSCPFSERKVERIGLEDLRVRDVVIAPDRVSFGSQPMDPEKAWVEGLYISDGDSKGHSFRIAGRDRFPREQQKRDVQELCAKWGIETKWFFNYIACYDADWTSRMKAMGTLPWNKRALSLDLVESSSRELLRGILADSGRNTNGAGRTFTTSSKELLLQTRILLKMNGISCSERFIEDHGSTSEYPVWRLGIRACQELDGLGKIYDKAWRKNDVEKSDPRRSLKLLRVKSIIKDGAEADCFDIATDDHYVWLPEADWTVSNCDDMVGVVCALALSVGLECAERAAWLDPQNPTEASHVWALVKHSSESDWTPIDVVAGQGVGFQPPASQFVRPPLDYVVGG